MPRRRSGLADDRPRSYRLSADAIDASVFGAFSTSFPGAINPANVEVYAPSASGLVPAGGAWVMIKRALPAIEGGIDEHVRPGRCLWVERSEGADEEGFVSGGLYKVVCHSPWGDVWLWPYEYATIEATTLVELWQAGELVFRPTRIDEARLNEVAFYCRSRGIPLGTAAVMALGTLSGPVGWFEPAPELVAEVEGFADAMSRIGGPLTAVNHARRAAARKRRSGS